MILKPVKDKLLVRRCAPETKTTGGIIIPDTAQERAHEAVVVAVGPGRLLADGTRSPMQTKAGDRILISKYSGMEVSVAGETLLFINEDDIIAVWEEE